jgi:hypothetical protein
MNIAFRMRPPPPSRAGTDAVRAVRGALQSFSDMPFSFSCAVRANGDSVTGGSGAARAGQAAGPSPRHGRHPARIAPSDAATGAIRECPEQRHPEKGNRRCHAIRPGARGFHPPGASDGQPRRVAPPFHGRHQWHPGKECGSGRGIPHSGPSVTFRPAGRIRPARPGARRVAPTVDSLSFFPIMDTLPTIFPPFCTEKPVFPCCAP